MAMEVFDRLAAAGYFSKSLKKSGLTPVDYKNALAAWAIQTILENYQSDRVVAIFGCFLFDAVFCPYTEESTVRDHLEKYGMSDLGLQDLDKLASLISTAMGCSPKIKGTNTIKPLAEFGWINSSTLTEAVIDLIKLGGGSVNPAFALRVAELNN